MINSKLNENGQSLVEVVIALGIAVIIVIAFTNATITSVRNSQYSKNQNLATKYAQESIELIRAIRDQNTVGSVSGDSINTWGDLWGMNLKNRNPTPSGYTGYCFSLNKTELTIATRLTCTDDTDENLDGTNLFYRKINVTDDGIVLTKKQINVKVYWSDNRGQHKTEVSTFLTNWQ